MSWMKKVQGINVRRCKSFKILFVIILSLFVVLLEAMADSTGADSTFAGLAYYLQLQESEFVTAMLPRERLLLSLANSVFEEIQDRKKEGAVTLDLGVGDIVSPGDRLIEAYDRELGERDRLLGQIQELERLARRKSNLEILLSLSALKSRILEMLPDMRSLSDSGPGQAGHMKDRSSGLPGETLALDRFHQKADSSGKAQQSLAQSLFNEWKYNRLLDFQAKSAKFEYLRAKLLKTATRKQEERMFRCELKNTLAAYWAGDLELSRVLLSDILAVYGSGRVLDDVLFYYSESAYGLNRLDEALAGYQRLMKEYPDSPLTVKAGMKILTIHYFYGQWDELSSVFQKIYTRPELLGSEAWSTAAYLMGYVFFQRGQYAKALTVLATVKPATTYYYPSFYISAACYSNLEDDESALKIYYDLTHIAYDPKKDPLLDQIQNNALLKSGFIYYERGDHDRARIMFDRVSRNFQNYDLSILGKAWSAYEQGKPIQSLKNAETLLREAMVSSYVYEAQVLAASSKEILGQKEEAIEDLLQVYRAGESSARGSAGKNAEPPQAEAVDKEGAESSRAKERNENLYREASRIGRFLNISSGLSGGSKENVHSATDKIEGQIEALDRLESTLGGQSGSSLDRIRRVRGDLIETLEAHNAGLFQERSSDADPLIRRMGMAEYLGYLFRTLLQETLREKSKTEQDMLESEALLDKARQDGNFDVQIRMEIKKSELEDYYARLNQHEIWLRENTPEDFRVDIGQWASFSGYGISNINFSRIKDIENRMSGISSLIGGLERTYHSKRQELEARVQDLLADVERIETEIGLETQKRKEKERNLFFQDRYFDRLNQESSVGTLIEELPASEEKP